MTESKTCATCRWWEGVGRGFHGDWGFCLNPINDEIDPATGFRRAARTHGHDTCGEHTPKEQANEA